MEKSAYEHRNISGSVEKTMKKGDRKNNEELIEEMMQYAGNIKILLVNFRSFTFMNFFASLTSRHNMLCANMSPTLENTVLY